MTTNEHLYVVSADFEEYEIVLGVADSPIQTLHIAARYRQTSRSQGWSFQKAGKKGVLTYLEYRKDGIGITSRISFKMEECTLNTLME